MIKNITYKKKLLATIIKVTYLKKKGLNFFTNPKLNQQVAFMSHQKTILYNLIPIKKVLEKLKEQQKF